MPRNVGGYRLFAYVTDGHGGAAVANIPLYVRGTAKDSPGKLAKLPMYLYDEAGRANPPYIPSGWMGNTKALKFDDRCKVQPHSAKTCIRIDDTAHQQWGAIAWQNPANDFEDKPGGWNLKGSKWLSVWLRGQTGKETVTNEFGVLGRDKKFPDSAKAKRANIKLSTEWRKYTLDATGKDMSRIKTGFVVSFRGAGRPTTIYVDDCRFE